MLRAHLTTARGQLVLWYLGVLAALLIALGIFQTLMISSYLRSSTADSVREGARAELAVLGACYIRSSADLRDHAQTLALLLGGPSTAVTIVTPGGQALASHGLGPPGATRPLRLSQSEVQQLIVRAGPAVVQTALPLQRCSRPPFRTRFGFHRQHPITFPSIVGGGNILLVSVPLGPEGSPFGYAILGRSLDSANETVARALLVFGLGAAAALTIAAVVALPIINRALRPLRRVADTAEAIAEGHLEQRANLARSPDEIGRLGEAFDAMVDRLQSALDAITASEERMRHFLADASHELRTPATVLRGASQVLLLQWREGPPALVAALEDMHAEAVRLARLVDDLLTLSRLDAGQPLAPQPVAVRPYLEEFLDRYGGVWQGRTIKVESEVDGAAAEVDPEALRRILTNLVDNAARYSRLDGTITIQATAQGDQVAIAVKDEGPGMTAEDARKVFDRFYRAHKSRARQSGGTGLGLSIVRSLAEQSGGRIDLDTAPDRGTTATVTLRRVAAPAPQQAAAEVRSR